MKKIKIFPIAAAAITCTLPIMTSVGCSKSTFAQLSDSLINEFKEICKIPHQSDKFLYDVPYKSNVMNLSNYLQDRIQKMTSQKVYQDQWGNLWCDIPYNDEKYKDLPTVALQAHMDMVFSYDAKKYPQGQTPDPKNTQIDVVEETINGKRTLHSRDYKTSIGADNGVGVAQILAIISNPEVKHGNLRVIITNCEENAMQGAKMLIAGTIKDTDKQSQPEKLFSASNPHVLDGVKYVLNIDGEAEGEIVTACSGGVGSHYNKTFNEATTPFGSQWKYKLTVDGFDGGHSGSAPAEHKGNALIIANEILKQINGDFGVATNKNIQISSISTPGITVYNSVATTCVVEFTTKTEITDEMFNTYKDTVYNAHVNQPEASKWKNYSDMHKDKWTLVSANFDKALDEDDSRKILNLQDNLGYGVIVWDKQSSPEEKTSRNIGPCTLSLTSDGKFDFKMSTYSRSDKASEVTAFKNSNMTLCKANLGDGAYSCDAEFPPWLGDSKRDLIELTTKAWKEAGVEKVTESRIHGGVECSWWSTAMKEISKISDGQIVSYGPSIDDCHQPTETLYLDTLEASLKTTLYILQNIK